MKKLDREIFRLAAPNVLSNISVPLLSTVDILLMGSLSSFHIAAVGVGAMIFNVIYWNFGFLRMATTGLVAQSYGQNDMEQAVLSLVRGLLLAVFISVIVLVFQGFIFESFSYLLNVRTDQEELVSLYFQIRIWACPAVLATYVLMGWFFGMQNSVLPMLITILVNISNISISFYLVQYSELQIEGVAIGTVLAQYFGLVVTVWVVIYRKKWQIGRPKWIIVFDWKAIVAYLKLNTDIFLRTVCLTTAFVVFYNHSNDYNSVVMAANIILLQFINWMSYVTDGFAYAVESLVGKYYGRKDLDTVESLIVRVMGWASVFAVLFTVVLYFEGVEFVRFFTQDLDVLYTSVGLIPYVCVFSLFAFISYIWDGVFIGLLATKSMRDTMLLSLATYLAAIVTLPELQFGSQIWVAFLIFTFTRGLTQSLWYWKYKTALT